MQAWDEWKLGRGWRFEYRHMCASIPYRLYLGIACAFACGVRLLVQLLSPSSSSSQSQVLRKESNAINKAQAQVCQHSITDIWNYSASSHMNRWPMARLARLPLLAPSGPQRCCSMSIHTCALTRTCMDIRHRRRTAKHRLRNERRRRYFANYASQVPCSLENIVSRPISSQARLTSRPRRTHARTHACMHARTHTHT